MTKTVMNAVNLYEETLDAYANIFARNTADYIRKCTLEKHYLDAKEHLTSLKDDCINMIMGMYRFQVIKSFKDYDKLYDRCYEKYKEVCIKIDDIYYNL